MRKFFVALDQTVLEIAKALEIVRREAAFEFPARAKKTGIDRIGNRPQVLQPVLDRCARHSDLDCAVQRLCGAGHLAGRILELLDFIVDDCRSEEHTSELQSLMRISYAVFCLK